MSSHWEWAKRQIKEFDETQPFAPENGQQLKFKAGDVVIFTNVNGVEFELTITGFAERSDDELMYAAGYRYKVNSSSPWFPVRESSLKLKSEAWSHAVK